MNVAVFCASAEKINKAYFNDALRLGQEIARKSWNLVYGGTNCGLMREVADATMANGGKAIGIIPECIRNKGVAADNLSELVVATDMKERKQLLRDYSDAFIALPGGWGTLEEITEVITLKQLGIHQKAIVFINTNNYYTPFFNYISYISDEGFVSTKYNHLYQVVDRVEEAIEYIANYSIENVGSKY